MTNVQKFLNEVFGEVRCYTDELNNPWFCANDCLKILEYKESGWRKIISRLNSKGVTKCHIHTEGGDQQTNFINEPNLFKLVFGSKMDKAEEFQDWICEIVIPSLRKDGAYIDNEEKLKNEEMSEDEFILQAMQILQKKVERYKEENKVLSGLTDSFLNGNHTYDIGVFSKIINTKDNKLGRNNLFKWLREHNILMANNTPYQNMVDYFKVITVENKFNGKINYKSLLTPKGVKYVYKRLLKDGKVIEKDFDTIIEELNVDNKTA